MGWMAICCCWLSLAASASRGGRGCRLPFSPLGGAGPVLLLFFVVRRPRHDAVSSVKRTLGLQQHRVWSNTLAEPYRLMADGCSDSLIL